MTSPGQDSRARDAVLRARFLLVLRASVQTARHRAVLRIAHDEG
jgi:DNA-binding transcriptional regulator YbjK